jgi:hypothetical protein
MESEGNITGPIKLTPVGMPEYNDLIEATLLARLKPGYIANIQEEGRETSDTDILTFIKDTLIECEALVADRVNTNLNTNLNRSVNDIINAFRNLDIPNIPNDNYHAEGGRRVGAVCPHGYENYREKIPMTRKRSHKKRKGTRKSKTN